jgi:hypothetical protein
MAAMGGHRSFTEAPLDEADAPIADFSAFGPRSVPCRKLRMRLGGRYVSPTWQAATTNPRVATLIIIDPREPPEFHVRLRTVDIAATFGFLGPYLLVTASIRSHMRHRSNATIFELHLETRCNIVAGTE